MGGGRRFPYPKWVWTPAGGWWNNNPNAKRNTAMLMGVWAVLGYFIYQYGEAHTITYERKFGEQVHKEGGHGHGHH